MTDSPSARDHIWIETERVSQASGDFSVTERCHCGAERTLTVDRDD